MKFYDCQTAPSPRRVRMFIAEKGIQVPTIEVNLRQREQLGETFLKLNPFATVPVLELDDATKLITTAGCRAYLESANPPPALLGRTDTERGQIADLVWRIEADGFMAVAECLRNSAKGMKDRALSGPYNYAQIPELAERGRERATRFFPVLDELLSDKLFLAGDSISAADLDAFIFIEFCQWIKLEIPAQCSNVCRWFEMMANRDSAKL
jgi:glutathione S-transferase